MRKCLAFRPTIYFHQHVIVGIIFCNTAGKVTTIVVVYIWKERTIVQIKRYAKIWVFCIHELVHTECKCAYFNENCKIKSHEIMLRTFDLKHYLNFKIMGSGFVPNIPWHSPIYFHSNCIAQLRWLFSETNTLTSSDYYRNPNKQHY